jgi:inorganic pyrophosphatase
LTGSKEGPCRAWILPSLEQNLQGVLMGEQQYWQRMDRLLAELDLVIDRPRGSIHPRFPDFIYPYDYGYLKGTQAMDGGGIDVWAGSQRELGVTGVICTVDLTKKDAEIKILLGCTGEETEAILRLHNDGQMSAVFVARPTDQKGT